jgi:hypothetical protein
MKKMAQYQIDAVVSKIVSEIEQINEIVLSPKKLKQVEIDSKEIKRLKDQIEQLQDQLDQIISKYEDDEEVDSYLCNNEIKPKKFEVNWNDRLQIRNEIIVKSLADEDIYSLISKMAKEFAKKIK